MEDATVRDGGRTGPRDALEERVVEAARGLRGGLVGLLADLVACDTTARGEPDEPPRDEERCQRLLADRLAALGAEVDLWEPPPTPAEGRNLPPAMGFAGRPQLAARLAGAGGGRSLLLLGHIDVVSAEPRERWSGDPFRLVERDGRLVGRGVVDMKGGLAGMVGALEALRRAGVRLAGDVVFCSVTDEESSGAGGFAAVERGVRADAGVCAEPTDFAVWVACRGSLTPTITIPGRPGHAEMAQPHWTEGGAVNAIDRLRLVLDAVARLNEEWRRRPDHRHPYVSPGEAVPVVVSGGEWVVTYPASCRLTLEVTYLPGHVDAEGTGRAVERELREWVDRAAAADPWLAANPLQWEWDCDVVPAEVAADHPLVGACREAAAEVGRPSCVSGFDSWHDGATFTRLGGTPTVGFGPGVTAAAHTIDEWLALDDLIDFAAATALLLMRWCGCAGASG